MKLGSFQGCNVVDITPKDAGVAVVLRKAGQDILARTKIGNDAFPHIPP